MKSCRQISTALLLLLGPRSSEWPRRKPNMFDVPYSQYRYGQ